MVLFLYLLKKLFVSAPWNVWSLFYKALYTNFIQFYICSICIMYFYCIYRQGEDYYSKGQIQEFYKEIRKSVPTQSTLYCLSKNGCLIDVEQKMIERWREHLSNLLNCERQGNIKSEQSQKPCNTMSCHNQH